MSISAQTERLAAAGHTPDSHQTAVIQALDRLLAELDATPRKRGWLLRRKPALVRGIYLWGGVGRGKTWLMDLFFDALEGQSKQRVHFHRFMQGIHDALKDLRGQSNPLQQVARRLAARTRVLCLDEFHVTDIGDAVILAALLRSLFAEGVTLVTTSNQPPERLYQGGIQRASFLPAIDLLQQYTRVMELGGDFDYRRQVAEATGVYHAPLGPDSEHKLWEAFTSLATEPVEQDGQLSILSRKIPFRYRAGGMVWCDFDALCGPPRSKDDYIELARRHHTVFISDIPRLDGSRDDRSRRFIFLIDEFYDRRVKLMVSADAQPDALYCGERLAFEFQRTASRLQEIQTADYLASPHLP